MLSVPKGPKRICRKCKKLHRNKSGYCDSHEPEAKSNWRKWQAKKGNRHERGYGGEWEAIRKQVIQRDKNLCQVCLSNSRLSEASAVDHIKSKSKGGNDDMSNLQSICTECHNRKTATE